MESNQPPAAAASAPAIHASLRRIGFLLAAAALAFWAVLLIRGPVDWDLGWQMHLADRILAGDKLYVDVGATEQHPPLYTWFCVAVTVLAGLLHTDPIRTLLTITAIASIAAVVVAARIARGGPLLVAGFGAAALAVHGLASGSGEQIATAFSLPYIAAAARMIRSDESHESVPIGIAAGLGMALKPHYALVWLLVELGLAWERKKWRSILRPTSIAAASVWIAYIAATLLFTPRYFHSALRAVHYYGAFMSMSVGDVIRSSPYVILLVAWLLSILLRRWSAHPEIARLLLLAATAMWLGGVIQMKGWYHHWTPALGLTIAAIAALWPARAQIVGFILVLLFATDNLTVMAGKLTKHQEGQPTFLPAMTAAVRTLAPDGPILVLSDGLAIGFPLVNFTGAEWTLPESSLWMVQGLYPDDPDGDPVPIRQPADWVPFERDVHDLIWTGIQRRPPRLVFAHGPRDSRIRQFVDADPRVRQYLAGWQTIGRIGPYEVMLPPPARPSP
ncbi:MAG TPA: hypothetical protein VF035_02470 [Longimicrobiales bacterium]